jgi:hypothetical protein
MRGPIGLPTSGSLPGARSSALASRIRRHDHLLPEAVEVVARPLREAATAPAGFPVLHTA